MSPATAKRAAKSEAANTDSPPLPMDLEQFEAKSLAASLNAYREFVGLAADGEQLDATDMAQVASFMRDLEIPALAWTRDVDAERKSREFNRQLDELLAGQAERDIEVQQLTSEIQHIERRLAEAKGRRHTLTVVVPNTISGYSQRLGQLAADHPHVFHGIDDVVRERIAAKAKKSATFRAEWGP